MSFEMKSKIPDKWRGQKGVRLLLVINLRCLKELILLTFNFYLSYNYNFSI